ncbi:uncharacterized protein LOC132752188 isoform X2 [Ruditapes philippinarum]|nr:uncharacterized protein LOC132752188 isoform X2 [Ruditapes philippinarum]
MLFKTVAERMVKDTKTVEKDSKFRQVMYDIWNNELKDLVNKHPDGGSELALAIQNKLITSQYKVLTYCFLRAVSHFPHGVVGMIANIPEGMGRQVAVIGGLNLVVAVPLGPVVTVALAGVFLAWEVIMNINRWWNGEITGKRCVKNIIDCGVGVAAGIVGGWTGQAIGGFIGSVLGPIGTTCGMVVGGVVCGILAQIKATQLCDLLTQNFFGLPKSEALENAYSFLDISFNASNGDVNSRYRHLALQFHPDKGGDPEMWAKLQYSMAIIRKARGEP